MVRRYAAAGRLPSAFVAAAEALLVAYGGSRGFPANTGAVLMGAPAVGMLLGNFAAGRFLRPSLPGTVLAGFLVVLGTVPPFPHRVPGTAVRLTCRWPAGRRRQRCGTTPR
ncbi:hypothetical protein [Dactylosporangium sp. NPDC006015]|uniref:hypothetical protein n=1 Tax=Dactylosporangium sp. NPDC006015 TaxID=3154576 RepID=UPI0033B74C8F